MRGISFLGIGLSFFANAQDRTYLPPTERPASFQFLETFQDGSNAVSSGRWFKSRDPKYGEQAITILEDDANPGDYGLVLEQSHRHYGIAASTPIIKGDNQRFVVQYEVKAEDGITCGGAYIKLLRDDTFDLKSFNNDSPYTIMFGPDHCGSTNTVHFILQHQNPISGVWSEKHHNDPAKPLIDKKSHVYTLVIEPDNSFAVYVDLTLQKEGNLLSSLNPPINPPKEIDDPNDKKPLDWVDDEKIPDPTAFKPEDWDETLPEFIEDADAMKPASWHEDESEYVPDPEARLPAEWDEEEDGAWEAPLVKNPLCESGCGPWKRPMKKNPEYKGKWRAPMIDNPAYKGVWHPKKIANEEFFEDFHPHNFAPIRALAVEIWTTNSNIRFDNLLIGTNKDDALKFGKQTWAIKNEREQSMEDDKRRKESSEERERLFQEGGFLNYVKAYSSLALDTISDNPGISVGSFVAFIVIVFGFLIYTAGTNDGPVDGQQMPINPFEEQPQEGTEERNEATDDVDGDGDNNDEDNHEEVNIDTANDPSETLRHRKGK